MVLDLNIKKKTMRRMVYVAGAFVEVVGLALLFNFDGTMKVIHAYPILFALILTIFGYILVVGARRIK